MDGVILIDKPQGFTSFDVVAKTRGILHTKRVGHAGTLDPMATGVLPVFVGRATKCCDILPVQDKKYRATFKLGVTTDTQDITGAVLSQQPPCVDEELIKQTIKSFVGEYDQIPPMYSAVKVGGKKLYELARKGIEVERKSRKITIYSIDILDYCKEENTFTIDVFCSKGSYIRTLGHDIGQKLGCGATMTALQRTQACGFDIAECTTLEKLNKIAAQGEAENVLLPISRLFSVYPKIWLNEKQKKMFQNGVRLSASRVNIERRTDGDFAVYYEEQFLGTAYIKEDTLIMRKLFLLGV